MTEELVQPGNFPLSSADTQWAEAVALDPRLAAFTDDPARASIVCTLHGHACVETGCFGYWHCDRCGDQVGDSLAGTYQPSVVRDHGYPQCEACNNAWDAADFWGRLGVLPNGGGFLQQPALFASSEEDQ